MYQLVLSPSARRFLKKSLANVCKQIDVGLLNLQVNPRNANVKKLTASNLCRQRVGDYRIIFELDDKSKIVIVHLIGNRKDIYK